MADRVERFGEIKEDEQGDHSSVNGQPDIIRQPDQRGLRTITSAEACLERIHNLRVMRIGGELIIDDAL